MRIDNKSHVPTVSGREPPEAVSSPIDHLDDGSLSEVLVRLDPASLRLAGSADRRLREVSLQRHVAPRSLASSWVGARHASIPPDVAQIRHFAIQRNIRHASPIKESIQNFLDRYDKSPVINSAGEMAALGSDHLFGGLAFRPRNSKPTRLLSPEAVGALQPIFGLSDLGLAWSGNGRRLALSMRDPAIGEGMRFWSKNTDGELEPTASCSLAGDIVTLDVAGKRACAVRSSRGGGTICKEVWLSNLEASTPPVRLGGICDPQSLRITPDGLNVIAVGEGLPKRWTRMTEVAEEDRSKGVIRVLSADPRQEGDYWDWSLNTFVTPEPCLDAAMDPRSGNLLSITNRGNIHLHNSVTGDSELLFRADTFVRAASIDADARFVAFLARFTGQIHIWSRDIGTIPQQSGHAVSGLSWAPDAAKLLVVSGHDISLLHYDHLSC